MRPIRAPSWAFRAVAALALAAALPVVLAHGGDGGMHMDGGDMETDNIPKEEQQYPETYFSHAEHAGLMYAHIVFMTLAWVFALPVGRFL